MPEGVNAVTYPGPAIRMLFLSPKERHLISLVPANEHGTHFVDIILTDERYVPGVEVINRAWIALPGASFEVFGVADVRRIVPMNEKVRRRA